MQYVLHLLFPRAYVLCSGGSSLQSASGTSQEPRSLEFQACPHTSDAAEGSGAQGKQKQNIKSVAKKQKEKAKSHHQRWLARSSGNSVSVTPIAVLRTHLLSTVPSRQGSKSRFIMDILKAKKNLFVDAKSIDLHHLEKDPEYFGEAIALCNQFDIVKIITFNKDFDPELVALVLCHGALWHR